MDPANWIHDISLTTSLCQIIEAIKTAAHIADYPIGNGNGKVLYGLLNQA